MADPGTSANISGNQTALPVISIAEAVPPGTAGGLPPQAPPSPRTRDRQEFMARQAEAQAGANALASRMTDSEVTFNPRPRERDPGQSTIHEELARFERDELGREREKNRRLQEELAEIQREARKRLRSPEQSRVRETQESISFPEMRQRDRQEEVLQVHDRYDSGAPDMRGREGLGKSRRHTPPATEKFGSPLFKIQSLPDLNLFSRPQPWPRMDPSSTWRGNPALVDPQERPNPVGREGWTDRFYSGGRGDRSPSPDYRGQENVGRMDRSPSPDQPRQGRGRAGRSPPPDHWEERGRTSRGRSSSPEDRGRTGRTPPPEYWEERGRSDRDRSLSPERGRMGRSTPPPEYRDQRGKAGRDRSSSPEHVERVWEDRSSSPLPTIRKEIGRRERSASPELLERRDRNRRDRSPPPERRTRSSEFLDWDPEYKERRQPERQGPNIEGLLSRFLDHIEKPAPDLAPRKAPLHVTRLACKLVTEKKGSYVTHAQEVQTWRTQISSVFNMHRIKDEDRLDVAVGYIETDSPAMVRFLRMQNECKSAGRKETWADWETCLNELATGTTESELDIMQKIAHFSMVDEAKRVATQQVSLASNLFTVVTSNLEALFDRLIWNSEAYRIASLYAALPKGMKDLADQVPGIRNPTTEDCTYKKVKDHLSGYHRKFAEEVGVGELRRTTLMSAEPEPEVLVMDTGHAKAGGSGGRDYNRGGSGYDRRDNRPEHKGSSGSGRGQSSGGFRRDDRKEGFPVWPTRVNIASADKWVVSGSTVPDDVPENQRRCRPMKDGEYWIKGVSKAEAHKMEADGRCPCCGPKSHHTIWKCRSTPSLYEEGKMFFYPRGSLLPPRQR
jgi:hypothetical protein